MTTYRGAKIKNEVTAEYTDNYYAKCKTCLKLDDGLFYKATMSMVGHDHVWDLVLLPASDYPMLYDKY